MLVQPGEDLILSASLFAVVWRRVILSLLLRATFDNVASEGDRDRCQSAGGIASVRREQGFSLAPSGKRTRPRKLAWGPRHAPPSSCWSHLWQLR